MYKLTDVSKTYPRGKSAVHALAGVDLVVEDGEQLAIQGPTGGGKSTLLQLLGALDRPTEGTVELDGHDLSKLSEARLTRLRAETIGFVFQSFNLIPTLNAQENVEAALAPLGGFRRRSAGSPLSVKAGERRERAAAALASVGLGERLSHLPAELSGGQQQRVAIARALVKQPKVLLADEPTGNLDEETRDEIMALLNDLWQSQGLTFILVTHDSSVARAATRVATLKKGQLTTTS